MAEEDVFRAAGLGSADESEDEPAIERPNGDTSQAGAVWSDSLGAPEAGTEEVPDDSDPAAVDTDRGGSADLGKTSDALKAAGLDDSDDEGGEEPGGAPEGDDDHADQLGEAPTEELPKPGAVQRLSGPPQSWEIPLVQRPQGPVHLATFKSILDIESQPFNREKFSLDDDVDFSESGARIPRAPPLNRLRWRFTGELDEETRSLKRESNARIVLWEDGTLSLFLGTECVDVVDTRIQGQQVLLGVYHEGSEVVQAQTLVRSKLAFRPPDVNSTLHKNVVQMTSRTEKAAHAIKASHILKDFHQEHLEAVDREQEQLKLKGKQEKGSQRKGVSALARRPPPRRVTAAFLEADDDDYDLDGQPVDAAAEDEAERRLMQAKQGAPQPRKRRLDDEDDVNLSDDSPPPGASKGKGLSSAKQQLTLDDSDDDF